MADADSPIEGQILQNLLLFGRLLRRLGLDVHAGRMLDAVHVLEDIGLRRRGDVQAALRTLLVHRREHLPVFDEAFSVFWRQRKDQTFTMDLRSMGEKRRYRYVEAGPPPLGQPSDAAGGEEQDSAEAGDRIDITRTFSAREVLQSKDFSEFTPSEMTQARQLMASLAWDPGTRRSRRLERGNGHALDLRRTLRDNAQYGGELLKLRHRRRKEKPRKLVVICDVSGSMERYTRMLLHFIHCLYGGLNGQVEAFLFATRLTRVTKQLQHRDIDQAVGDVAKAVPDWSGGTRIGAALKEFNFMWARRTLGWGSIVLVVSDGWDRGEPELLGQRDGAAPAEQPAAHLAEPAGRQRKLRAADAGASRGDTLHRRPAAGAQPGGADGPRAAPQRARGRVAVAAATAHGLRRPRRKPSRQATAPGQRSWHRDANPTFRHPLWGRGDG